MNHSRPPFILPALISTCALALALTFASTAAAEVRSGEASSAVDAAIPGEATPRATSRAAPAALSIAMSGRLRLKAGKWTKVKVEVSDNGGSATGPVTVKVRRKVGVVVKPASGKLRLPALQAGQTEAVYFELKLAGKANSKWAISLTGSAAGPTAKRSVRP